jgi:ParB family chromosome partitioning protein
MSKTTKNETHREVTMITLDKKLQGYPEAVNPFKPYKGKQLDRLTDSIKVNGVIHPVIVRAMKDGINQILSGHNRVNAAKAAGLTHIPAIVRNDLTDDQAEILMIESNIEQRTFSNFLPSERVKSIHQYNAKV